MENEINGCHYDGPEGKVVKWKVGTTESTLCPAVSFGISGVKPSGFSAIVLVRWMIGTIFKTPTSQPLPLACS
jgi:hypothetical protein